MKRGTEARQGIVSSGQFHSAAVYLALGEARIRTGFYRVSARWMSAAREWQDCQANGARMPILFGDAQHDSGRLFLWAVIDTLAVSDEGTTVTFSEIMPLDGPTVDSLIKNNDGKPLARALRRGYSVVRTPAYLDTPSRLAANESEIPSDPEAFESVLRRIRRYQGAFRSAVEIAYRGTCAITGTSVPTVLQAAHISPHAETGDNRAENGLLLRVDLHALFDENLIGIDPDTLTVHVAPALSGSDYASFQGRQLHPRSDGRAPDAEALTERWRQFVAINHLLT